MDPITETARGAAQGLGIAAMLRRLRLRFVTFPAEGKILLEPYALQSWTLTTIRKAEYETYISSSPEFRTLLP